MSKTTDHHILGDLIDPKAADEVLKLILKAKNILIISHRLPDADAIGANLALKLAFENAERAAVAASVNPPPLYMSFIEECKGFQQAIDLSKHDLIISVDCGSIQQLGFDTTNPEILNFKPFINIDHHSSNPLFGSINVHSIKVSSTSELIYRLLKYWQLPITPKIATLLLAGIYYDTGSFMHTNTNSDVLEIAHSLMQHGADFKNIIKNFYHNFSEEKFHIWGELLSNFQITDNHVITSVVNSDDLKRHNVDEQQLLGIIDYLSSAEESKYTVFINQNSSDSIKGSLRTRNDNIDLSKLAKNLGGGGHKKACGFSLPAKLEKQTIWKITTAVNKT